MQGVNPEGQKHKIFKIILVKFAYKNSTISLIGKEAKSKHLAKYLL